MHSLKFDETQLEAVNRCVNISSNNRVVPVTGQAGTGKTSIMRYVYDALVGAGYRVAACAPTGKAAKRITEATDIPAVTIHRLLEYPHPGERDPETGKQLSMTDPKRYKFNPLEYDIVLGDEWAMVNWELHRNVLDALPRGGCLRVFGDVNQLPPIERSDHLRKEPSPFETILKTFKGVYLDTIHRQDEGSDIIINATHVLHGRLPRRLNDFTLGVTNRPVDALRAFVVEMREEHGVDFSKQEHQIITPTRKTWIGTAKLNAMLQSIFRPESDGWLELKRNPWATDTYTRVRVGDKVLCTENDYNLDWLDHDYIPVVDDYGRAVRGIFNGETGTICRVDHELDVFYIDVGDRIVEVPSVATYEGRDGLRQYHPQKRFDLAYAITTHKAQGSEYDTIVYMLNKSCMFMQSRSNFYTGITRAKKRVHVITDQRSLSHTVWNNRRR